MKNIFKYFVVCLFCVVSVSASAQTTVQSIGSKHLFKVNAVGASPAYTHHTDHKDNIYTWKVFTSDVDEAETGPATNGTEFTFKKYDGTTLTLADDLLDAEVTDVANLFAVGIQWNTPGYYLVEVAEINAGTGACATRRRMHINVTAGSIDLAIITSTNVGAVVSGDALTDCNGASNDIITGTDFGKTVRYFAVSMATDGQAWNGDWGFDFTVAESNGTGDLTSAVVTNETAGATVSGNKVTVTGGNPTVVLKVTVDNTPGPSDDTHPNAANNHNISLNFTADSGTPFIVSGGNQFEPGTNDANNTPGDPFVITASPNTSVLSID